MGSQSIVADRGARSLALTIAQFCSGRGAAVLVAVLLTFAGVVASASRAVLPPRCAGRGARADVIVGDTTRFHTSLGGCRRSGRGAAAALLIVFNGNTLGERLSQLLDTGITDDVRLALWAAANRMIADAPWFGLGLGTFQDAYPLYATQLLPYVMDKAHCDYLELAAGLGLPAAVAWWCAMTWLFVVCIRGVRIRAATGSILLLRWERQRLSPSIPVSISVCRCLPSP